MSPRITPNNYAKHLLKHANKLNPTFYVDAACECPYDLGFDNQDYACIQESVWFVHSRIDPRTGLTMLGDLVREYVKNKKTAAKILQAENLTHDEFETLENKDGIMTIRAAGDGTVYRVQAGNSPGDLFQAGDHFLGLIHPWEEDGTYKFAGSLLPLKGQ